MAGIRYQRRSNWIGWLAFFAIGGCVFVGLLIALQFLKLEQEKREDAAADKVAQQQDKLLDPKTQIRTAISDYHKKKGEGYEIVAVNPPKKVQSKIDGKEIVMARVQHRGTSSEDGAEKPQEDHVLLIKYLPKSKVEVQMVKFEDWDEKKAQYGIEDEP